MNSSIILRVTLAMFAALAPAGACADDVWRSSETAGSLPEPNKPAARTSTAKKSGAAVDRNTQAAAQPSLFQWLSAAFDGGPFDGNTESLCPGAEPPIDIGQFSGKGPFSIELIAALKKATVRISMQSAADIDRILKAELGVRNYDLGSLGELLDDYPPGLGGGFCTGTLILSNVVLSAGHCISPLDIYNKKGIPPSVRYSNGAFHRYMTPAEIAKLLKADFNYQLNYVSTIDPLTVMAGSQSFSVPVDGLIDWSFSSSLSSSPRDHMILRLKKTRDDLGDYAFGLRRIDYGYVPKGAALAIIQHPDGQPKKIAAGTLKGSEGRRLYYADIGTEGGSSGAAILNKWGKLAGLHTGGGCGNAALGYVNRGIKISTIKPALDDLKRD